MTQKADEIYELARQGENTYVKFRSLIKEKEQIDGRTMKEWEQFFRLDMPESPDPELCKQTDVKLVKLHHIATFQMNVSKMAADTAESTYSILYRKEFAEVYEFYKRSGERMPASGTMENLAKVKLEDTERVKETAKREVDFWKRIISNLEMQRRLVNDATICNGIQVKMDAKYSGNID